MAYQKVNDCRRLTKNKKRSDTVVQNEKIESITPLGDPSVFEDKFGPAEKSLIEMGFKANEISSWDEIDQPDKRDLLEILYERIKKIEMPDVHINIGDKTFKCHMLVLQCYSEYFKNISACGDIDLPAEQVTVESFILIYEWMLQKKPKLERDRILEVFNAATFLQIAEIENQFWACLDDGQIFREDTAFLLYLEAGKYKHDHAEQIQQLMLTRICKFFSTLVASREFLEMSTKELCQLLQSNFIGVNCETEVLMAAIRWLHHDFEQRKKFTLAVMECVRFGLISPWHLVELKRNTSCKEMQKTFESQAVQNLMDDGLSYSTTKYYYIDKQVEFIEKLSSLKLKQIPQRQWICDETLKDQNKEVITYQKFVQYLDYVRSRGKDYWEHLQYNKHGGPYADHHSQDKDDVIVLKDEATQNSQTNMLSASKPLKYNNSSVSSLESIRMAKTSRPRKSEPYFVANPVRQNSKIRKRTIRTRSHTKLGTSCDKDSSKSILLFGGLNPYERQKADSNENSVLLYDFENNQWNQFAKMPGARHDHSAVVCNQTIYIVGGTKPAIETQLPVILDTVWSYNPRINKWSKETRLPRPRRNFGIIAIENGFYVIGGEGLGCQALGSMLFYDIKTKTWCKRAQLKKARSGLMVIGNTTSIMLASTKQTKSKESKTLEKIWAAGGITDIRNFNITDDIEEYDMLEDVWYTVGRLRIPRCYGTLCIINKCELYCVGGLTNIDGITLSLQDVDRYYPETNEWKCVVKMPTHRHGHDLITIDDKIIILGGVSLQDEKTFKSIECYSTDQFKWINGMASLPAPLSSTSAIAYDFQNR